MSHLNKFLKAHRQSKPINEKVENCRPQDLLSNLIYSYKVNPHWMTVLKVSKDPEDLEDKLVLELTNANGRLVVTGCDISMKLAIYIWFISWLLVSMMNAEMEKRKYVSIYQKILKDLFNQSPTLQIVQQDPIRLNHKKSQKGQIRNENICLSKETWYTWLG